jgi:hypothetical protein
MAVSPIGAKVWWFVTAAVAVPLAPRGVDRAGNENFSMR